jgi:hypothetical protein
VVVVVVVVGVFVCEADGRDDSARCATGCCVFLCVRRVSEATIDFSRLPACKCLVTYWW